MDGTLIGLSVGGTKGSSLSNELRTKIGICNGSPLGDSFDLEMGLPLALLRAACWGRTGAWYDLSLGDPTGEELGIGDGSSLGDSLGAKNGEVATNKSHSLETFCAITTTS